MGKIRKYKVCPKCGNEWWNTYKDDIFCIMCNYTEYDWKLKLSNKLKRGRRSRKKRGDNYGTNK